MLSAAGLVSALESNASAGTVPPALRITMVKLATRWASETAATVGGLGASASVVALLEGVVNAMKIKKLAIIGAGLVALAAMGVVIVDRAAAVGGPPGQETLSGSEGSTARPTGPDGRPIGALRAATLGPQRDAQIDTSKITQTYYVGDITGMTRPLPTVATQADVEISQAAGVSPTFDVDPIRDLITSTVAPGTWEILVPGDHRPKKGNCIVPFYLSASLIIRGSKEVHDQVANLLRRLRVLMEAKDALTAQQRRTQKPEPQPALPDDPPSRARNVQTVPAVPVPAGATAP